MKKFNTDITSSGLYVYFIQDPKFYFKSTGEDIFTIPGKSFFTYLLCLSFKVGGSSEIMQKSEIKTICEPC